MSKVLHHFLLAALLAILAPRVAGATGAFNQFVGLGDSTLDSGYFRYASTGNASADAMVAAAIAGGAQGGWAGPGVMTATFLAGRFGLSAETVSAGGTNFANGSAYTAPLSASPGGSPAPGGLSGNVATTQQIANLLASTGGVANAHALYVVNSGNNDLIFVQNQGAAWIAANPTFLSGVACEFTAGVAALQAAGARTIMVPNTFYTSTLTDSGGIVPASNVDDYARAVAYGNTKWSYLTAAGVRFIPADLTSLFQFVATTPLPFGFTPSSVLSANAPSPVAALVTTWADITPVQLQTSLFVDGHHLTTAGQKIESDYEVSLLTAPSLMSLLAEAPVQGGLARAAVIQGQIDLSGQHRGPTGVNVWIGGGVGALALRNFSGFPDVAGTPFTGSAGVDYQMPFGLIVGAAFTAGTQTQRFSMGGGHFEQNDQAISLYCAYQAGPVWGNVVASSGWYQDTIARDAPLGLFTDSNSADTTGTALALALRAGGDIQLGPVTTGPVAGLVLQRVRIKGFAESGTSGGQTGGNGVTALSFGEQIRDSAISQLGWRAAIDVGDWRPFVEAKWNHELVDQSGRKVRAALTSTTAAPYSMAAAPVQSDWATASAGTSYTISERVMVRGCVAATAFDAQTVSYGGDVGVSVSF
ncbi:MAG: autotransporter domain-containing protein [Solidesulfovibrio sp.]|uniref:autotransporter outer membrane beta-barrel domain-containing protein n=1 Tax=Solidesulfovibrio sp. TaxID=2910990 RepID=UPI002B20CFC8|nr:autotransporter domain-containing protein [Solidesulfovibrio sp.]MEA4856179.1 autotransporter domain-containing protein [Solidesulfovibrio sp.]